MGMFQTREPRKYRPVSMYTSERKDKLVKDVKREMGELSADDIAPDHFKGKFAQFTPRASRSAGRRHRLTWPLVLFVVLVLLLLWYYILIGRL